MTYVKLKERVCISFVIDSLTDYFLATQLHPVLILIKFVIESVTMVSVGQLITQVRIRVPIYEEYLKALTELTIVRSLFVFISSQLGSPTALVFLTLAYSFLLEIDGVGISPKIDVLSNIIFLPYTDLEYIQPPLTDSVVDWVRGRRTRVLVNKREGRSFREAKRVKDKAVVEPRPQTPTKALTDKTGKRYRKYMTSFKE